MTSLLQKVRYGIKTYLKPKKPNWFKTIKLTKLHLGDVDNCILGQLFGSYHAGLNELGLHGDVWDDRYYAAFSSRAGNWDVLTQVWKKEIKRLRAKKKVAA